MGEFLWNSLVPHEAQNPEAEEITLDQDRDSGEEGAIKIYRTSVGRPTPGARRKTNFSEAVSRDRSLPLLPSGWEGWGQAGSCRGRQQKALGSER